VKGRKFGYLQVKQQARKTFKGRIKCKRSLKIYENMFNKVSELAKLNPL